MMECAPPWLLPGLAASGLLLSLGSLIGLRTHAREQRVGARLMAVIAESRSSAAGDAEADRPCSRRRARSAAQRPRLALGNGSPPHRNLNAALVAGDARHLRCRAHSARLNRHPGQRLNRLAHTFALASSRAVDLRPLR